MSNTFRKIILAFALVAVFLALKSCGVPEGDPGPAPNTRTQRKASTQALILTQDFTFDPENKDRVEGKYLQRKEITVPPTLTPQNKWIMFEGPVLENDKVAYRYYADARHRFDIYGKRVSDLVMDTVGWNYHDIMDWGSDILKVGNSLGLGSPAIYYRDSVYPLERADVKTIEVIKTHGEESKIRTTWKNLSIAGHEFDLIQDWSLRTGNYHSTIHLYVPGGRLPEGMKFVTGFVSHLPEAESGETVDSAYLMTWGKQSFHKENLGMAVFSKKQHNPVFTKNDGSHILIMEGGSNGVVYGFMAVWHRDQSNTTDATGFRMMVEAATM